MYKKVFPLGTAYSKVIGFLNLLNKRLKQVHRIPIDRTGVGEVFVEDANADGAHLSLPQKQEIMTFLKQAMENERFSHPSGARDDSLWDLALAVYPSWPERPAYHPVVLTGFIVKPIINYSSLVDPKRVKRPPVAGEWPICMACGQYRKKGVTECSWCHGNRKSPPGRPMFPTHGTIEFFRCAMLRIRIVRELREDADGELY